MDYFVKGKSCVMAVILIAFLFHIFASSSTLKVDKITLCTFDINKN